MPLKICESNGREILIFLFFLMGSLYHVTPPIMGGLYHVQCRVAAQASLMAKTVYCFRQLNLMLLMISQWVLQSVQT